MFGAAYQRRVELRQDMIVSDENGGGLTVQGQSRGRQTAIIVTAIVAAATMVAIIPGILEQRREYDRIYPGCWQLVGRDQVCEMRTNVEAFLRGH